MLTSVYLLHRRKSPQWFGLRRAAAEVVAADSEYLAVMRDYCISDRMVEGRCGQRIPQGLGCEAHHRV